MDLSTDMLLFEAYHDLEFDSWNDDSAVTKCIETLRILLSKGVNVNARGWAGGTLLHHIMYRGDRHVEIVKFLIESGIDINLKDNEDMTAFNVALENYYDASISEIMKILLKAGADVNTKGRENWGGNAHFGMTALHVAAKNGDVELAKLLIDLGADVNTTDTYTNPGYTPLHYAAEYVMSEDPTMFKILLLANADVNARDSQGKTPCHCLFLRYPKFSLCKIVGIFFKFGADLNAFDDEGMTPADLGFERRQNKNVVEALVMYGGASVNSVCQSASAKASGQTILHMACRKGDLPTIKFLLEKGANINTLDSNNESPLYSIIEMIIFRVKRQFENDRLLESLNYLLEWSDPDVNTITIDGFNILSSNSDDYTPNFLWKIIIQHLAKLQANNSHICTSLLKTISDNTWYDAYFEKCKKELVQLKSNTIHADSDISYFNLLVDDKKELIQYSGNKDILMKFNDLNKVVEKFPIYGILINRRLLKSIIDRNT